MKNSISFDELLTSKLGYSGQFKVDKYQRFYKWSKKQCQKIFNDILEWSKTSHDVKDYFIQSVAIFQEIVEILIQIVDGQQRITSLSLLHIAYRNVILDYLDINDERNILFKSIADNILYIHIMSGM